MTVREGQFCIINTVTEIQVKYLSTNSMIGCAKALKLKDSLNFQLYLFSLIRQRHSTLEYEYKIVASVALDQETIRVLTKKHYSL